MDAAVRRGAAVAQIAAMVVVATLVMVAPAILTRGLRSGAVSEFAPGFVLGLFILPLFALIKRDEARRRSASREPRWDGLRDLGVGREAASWFAIVTLVLATELWLSDVWADPQWTVLIPSAFLGLVTAAFLAIRRRFQEPQESSPAS